MHWDTSICATSFQKLKGPSNYSRTCLRISLKNNYLWTHSLGGYSCSGVRVCTQVSKNTFIVVSGVSMAFVYKLSHWCLWQSLSLGCFCMQFYKANVSLSLSLLAKNFIYLYHLFLDLCWLSRLISEDNSTHHIFRIRTDLYLEL